MIHTITLSSDAIADRANVDLAAGDLIVEVIYPPFPIIDNPGPVYEAPPRPRVILREPTTQERRDRVQWVQRQLQEKDDE